MTRIVNNEVCGIKGCDKPGKKIIYFSLGFSANFCTECADDLATRTLGIVEVNNRDKNEK
jgi:hypothetical protein